MNELLAAVRTVNLAVKTVRFADAVKKAAVILAAVICCLLIYRRRKG